MLAHNVPVGPLVKDETGPIDAGFDAGVTRTEMNRQLLTSGTDTPTYFFANELTMRA